MKKLSDFIKVPFRLFWDVTSECNFHCKHCYASAGKKLPDELTHEEMLDLVDEFGNIGIFRLFIAGGEPLMREDLWDVLRRTSEHEIPTVMNTNGYFIDEEMAKKLSQSGLDVVSISLDGSVPTTHEDFRGMKGSFERAVNAITLLNEHGVHTTVGCVLHRKNYSEIPDLIDICIECGAKLLNILRLAPVGRAALSDEFSLTFAMYEEVIQYLEQGLAGLKDKISLVSNDPIVSTWLKIQQSKKEEKEAKEKKKSNGRYCQAASFSGYVQANGDVFPCGYFPVLLGNVRKSSLKSIWASSEAEKIRELAGQLPSECVECEYLSYCHGGCRGVCYSLYQTTNARDPVCFKEFQKEREIL